MNEFTIENIANAYRRALAQMREPYRKVAQVQPAPEVIPERQFMPPPTKLPVLSNIRPGFMRSQDAA